MRESLTWLWDHVVSPVFQYMQLTPPESNRRRPQVSWICTGAMSNAPVHAATNYRIRDRQSTALRFCLPAHASTIKMNASTQDDTSNSDVQGPAVKLLGVKMATMPERSSPSKVWTKSLQRRRVIYQLAQPQQNCSNRQQTKSCLLCPIPLS